MHTTAELFGPSKLESDGKALDSDPESGASKFLS